jgi:uncharacterized Fe-S cluster protein YjdI
MINHQWINDQWIYHQSQWSFHNPHSRPPMAKPIQTYETEDIMVTFEPAVCEHSGVCVRGLPAVFDSKRKRWIRPELANADEVAAQVERCPSGALQYRRK